MFATIDWTTVIVSLIGFATVIASGAVAIRLKRIELRAAEHAAAARKSQQIAQQAATRAKKPRRRRKGRGGHPCD